MNFNSHFFCAACLRCSPQKTSVRKRDQKRKKIVINSYVSSIKHKKCKVLRNLRRYKTRAWKETRKSCYTFWCFEAALNPRLTEINNISFDDLKIERFFFGVQQNNISMLIRNKKDFFFGMREKRFFDWLCLISRVSSRGKNRFRAGKYYWKYLWMLNRRVSRNVSLGFDDQLLYKIK